MKKILLALSVVMLLTTSVLAKGEKVISLGKDLNPEQRAQMMNLLGADEKTRVIETTNQEERKYLGKYVDSKLLGSRAISSSYVEKLKSGQGIQAEVYNVTWVTEDMIINALVTAGVEDARVKVAAPFSVSGTAALTGILKGFEDATGVNISEVEKQIANEEIAKTGELGQEIGKDEAAQIMKKVKEQIVENKIKNPEQIKEIVRESAREINITLTDEQIQKITELMEKISNLDLDLDQIKSQLKNISDKLSQLNEKSEEVKSILGKIFDFIKNIFEKLFGSE